MVDEHVCNEEAEDDGVDIINPENLSTSYMSSKEYHKNLDDMAELREQKEKLEIELQAESRYSKTYGLGGTYYHNSIHNIAVFSRYYGF